MVRILIPNELPFMESASFREAETLNLKAAADQSKGSQRHESVDGRWQEPT